MNANVKHKILLIQSHDKCECQLENVLRKAGYHLIIAESIETSIQKVTVESLDLIICNNNLHEYTGLNVYKLLKPHLLNYGIPFFLYSEKIEKDDILIGLEMGIDNFIFSPVDDRSIVSKVKNQLRKQKEINIFKTDGFKNYFYTSSVAMMFVFNLKIELVNDTFCKLINRGNNEVIQKKVDDLFDLTSNQQNNLAYRKFINGVSESANLRNIKCRNNPALSYNMSLYRGNNLGSVNFFAEIVPSVISAIYE